MGRGWQEEAECSIRWREEISSQLMQVMDAQWPSFPVSGDGGGRWKRKWKAGRQRTCIIRPDSLLLPIPPRLQIHLSPTNQSAAANPLPIPSSFPDHGRRMLLDAAGCRWTPLEEDGNFICMMFEVAVREKERKTDRQTEGWR